MRRKQGEALEIIKVAVDELSKHDCFIERKEIVDLAGLNGNQTDVILRKLVSSGYLIKVKSGIYQLRNDEKPEQVAKSINPLEELTNKFVELPNLLQSMMDSVIDLMIEPEMEILNLIERRNKRIEDYKVLLDKSKIELSNSRAKIEELVNKLNRLSAQKNRVIPEDKIVFRN